MHLPELLGAGGCAGVANEQLTDDIIGGLRGDRSFRFGAGPILEEVDYLLVRIDQYPTANESVSLTPSLSVLAFWSGQGHRRKNRPKRVARKTVLESDFESSYPVTLLRR